MTVLRGGRALQIDVPVASIRTRLVSALDSAKEELVMVSAPF